ncbi:HD domain-containing protein [Paenalkalicoccus suaedae]|uniref:bis(5'-nucleosyl)-tetraphosphatase (symmetrical) n=1 Tax=Paenalkalicoccus suaedae TaxID=2592382 RepID=A0A859FE19_9BACI|nr:bis(5'-nucleosyl)-tetraphosphatase (symmetrical) YqeK [Paenalkalicoccus suaedae]QKS70834.1 HD domain-containing protein [Paenalkalicoccus suaedae]
MNESKALHAVESALKRKRFEHTVRVVETATELQKQYGGNLNVIRLAAILHDYAKYRPIAEMQNRVKESDSLPNNLLDYGDELLHAFVGAEYVKEELQVTNKQVLSAITYHTTGKKNMSKEEMIVFLADYIEPGRTFQGAELAREAAKTSLERGCMLALKQTIAHLVSKERSIYPDTFKAYNSLITTLEKDRD